MILSAQSIRRRCLEHDPPLLDPFVERGVSPGGKSFGLSAASYDVRLDQPVRGLQNPRPGVPGQSGTPRRAISSVPWRTQVCALAGHTVLVFSSLSFFPKLTELRSETLEEKPMADTIKSELAQRTAKTAKPVTVNFVTWVYIPGAAGGGYFPHLTGHVESVGDDMVILAAPGGFRMIPFSAIAFVDFPHPP